MWFSAFDMKRIVPLLLLLLAICGGCASRYSIIMTNGEVISANGKPKYNAEKAVYLYKDVNGQTRFVFAAKVREISPASMADKNGSQFLK
jgi:hypothetical protein